MGRNEVLVDGSHSGDIETDEPHRSSRKASNGTSNCLHTPALGVVDVARFEENVGGDDPGPEELPEDTGPPE